MLESPPFPWPSESKPRGSPQGGGKPLQTDMFCTHSSNEEEARRRRGEEGCCCVWFPNLLSSAFRYLDTSRTEGLCTPSGARESEVCCDTRRDGASGLSAARSPLRRSEAEQAMTLDLLSCLHHVHGLLMSSWVSLEQNQ
jgi:hypothetical protein